MPSSEEHAGMRHLIEQNTKLLEENNRLLKKLHRFHIYGAWIKVLWLALIIGLPFALYFYVLEPYFERLGASYEVFHAGISEIPGLKGLEHLLEEAGTSTKDE